jgi:diguanylate cyclase (GGDEF)-like protein
MKDRVIALNLRHNPREEADTLVRLLEESWGLLRDFVEAADDAKGAASSQRFEACRTQICAGVPLQTLAASSSEAVTAAREIVGGLKAARAERAREMAALVTVVRDAVASVGCEVTTLHSAVKTSTDRFEAIGQMNDPRQIKTKLLSEVIALKQVAATRRKTWEDTQRNLNERVSTLETQLVVTQSEASTDPLTGVANRRTFERTCQDWIRTGRSSFVLAMLDVDDFKHVNDTYGHDVGDQVLQFIAQKLVRSLRSDDVVARLGGDEFAILACNLPLAQAEHRLRTLVQSIVAPGPANVGRPECMPALSCGLAEFSAGDTLTSVMKRADDALYDAKRQGKNRLVARTRPFIRDLK